MSRSTAFKRLAVGVAQPLLLIALFGAMTAGPAWADTAGQRLPAPAGVRESTTAIMERQAASPPRGPRPEHEFNYPDRSHLPQSPGALPVSRYPAPEPGLAAESAVAPRQHMAVTTFDGATLTDTGAFPPDSMGTVGPTQFIVFVNGRIRSFTKAGAADGVLNADPDVFFASVLTPVISAGRAQLHQRSADPLRPLHGPLVHEHHRRAVHDRQLLGDRRQPVAARGERRRERRHDHRRHGLDLLPVQDRPRPTSATTPRSGVDVNALYVGCNMFTAGHAFAATNGYVDPEDLGAGRGSDGRHRLSPAWRPEPGRGRSRRAASTTSTRQPPRATSSGVDNAAFSTIDVPAGQQPGVGDADDLRQHQRHRADHDLPQPGDPRRQYRWQQRPARLPRRPPLRRDDPQRPTLWTAHNFRVSAAGVAGTDAQRATPAAGTSSRTSRPRRPWCNPGRSSTPPPPSPPRASTGSLPSASPARGTR